MYFLTNISSLRDFGHWGNLFFYQYSVPLGLSRRDNILVESQTRVRIKSRRDEIVFCLTVINLFTYSIVIGEVILKLLLRNQI